MDEDEWDRVLDTNLKGTFLVTRAAARQMLAQEGPYPWSSSRGKIVTIASGAHRSARVGASHYCASKAGLVLFSQALALELAEHQHQRQHRLAGASSTSATGRASRPSTARRSRRRSRGGGSASRTTSPRARLPLLRGGRVHDRRGDPVDGGSSAGRFFLPRSQQ